MENYVIESKNRQSLLMVLICAGAFIANLDASIVNIALPTLATEFQVNPSMVSWTILAYLLCETAFMLPFGKLADMKGIKPVYLSGFIVFMLGSILCGFSLQIEELIIFRAFQGIGGAMLFTVMMAFIPIYLPSERHVRAMGLATTAAALGVALGPPMGGWITSFIGWRWIFFANIPFCIAAIYGTWRIIPSAYPRSAEKKFDYLGSFYSFGALMFFLFSINMGREYGWTSVIIVSCLSLFFIFTFLFVLRERKIDYPLIDIKLLSSKNMSCNLLAFSASLMTVGGVLFIFPFYLEEYHNIDTHVAGMIMMLISFGQFIGPFTGNLSKRLGTWWLCVVGMAMGILSFILFLLLDPLTSLVFIALSLSLFGLSQGLSKAPNCALIMSSAPPNRQSAVSSIVSMSRSLSIALGVLFFETIFSDSIPHHISYGNVSLGSGLSHVSEMAPGFLNTFLFGSCVSLVAIVLILETRKQSIK